MPLSPEESQGLTNLQQRILANIQKGLPPAAGIEREELSSALKLLRGDRAKALAAGLTKAPRKKSAKAAPQSETEALSSLDSKLKGKGIDLSKLD